MLPGVDASSLWRKFQVSQQLQWTLTSTCATHLIPPTIPWGRAVVTTISIFTDEPRPGEMKQLTQDQMVTLQVQRRSAWLQTRALTMSLAGLLLGFPEPIASVLREKEPQSASRYLQSLFVGLQPLLPGGNKATRTPVERRPVIFCAGLRPDGLSCQQSGTARAGDTLDGPRASRTWDVTHLSPFRHQCHPPSPER